jgi:mono/diheme cytochrome c family protein
MKKIQSLKILISLVVLSIASCAGPTKEKTSAPGDEKTTTISPAKETTNEKSKGIGEVKNVELKSPLEQERLARGKAIYDMKCAACHKLNADRVVGPGWAGITKRRTPEWIMNMITNVDVMLDNDPEAQKLLELCLTRMPNQNVSIGDARDILEYMRQNDGEQ